VAAGFSGVPGPEPAFPGASGVENRCDPGLRWPSSGPSGLAAGFSRQGARFSFAAGNRRRRFAVLVTGDRENDRSTIILIRCAIVVFVFRQMISFSNAKSLHAAFDETPLI
jgi:hypothetical protein